MARLDAKVSDLRSSWLLETVFEGPSDRAVVHGGFSLGCPWKGIKAQGLTRVTPTTDFGMGDDGLQPGVSYGSVASRLCWLRST